MTPEQKAYSLMEQFCNLIPMEASIEWPVEKVNDILIADKEACRKCAQLAVTQILKLAGLPQFQIVYWRQVEAALINI